METTSGSARLLPVSDDADAGKAADPAKVARGAEIERRRKAANMNIEELAAELGADRGVLGRAEKGKASELVFRAAETWLDRFEDATRSLASAQFGEGQEPPAGDVIELTVRIGALDWSVTAKGPTDKAEIIEKQVADLMARAIHESKTRTKED